MDNHHMEEEEEGHFISNGSSSHHRITPLELDGGEEERDSLIRETADVGRAASLSNLKFRHVAKHYNKDTSNGGSGLFQGFLRGAVGSHFSLRNFVLLATLAICVLLWTQVLDFDLEHSTPEDTLDKPPPHQPSFGGSKNPGHYQQPNTPNDNDDDDDDESLPVSNIGHAVPSITSENVKNDNAHYLHDPFNSPFASPLYADKDAKQRNRTQLAFESQRKAIMKRYGFWESPDYSDLALPDCSQFDYRDMPIDEFPQNAWQLDENYVQSFLMEAMRLVIGVEDAIFEEYGYGLQTVDNDDKLKQLQKERDSIFGVIVNGYTVRKDGVAVDKEDQPVPGVAYLNQKAWDGLIRKLLHAMMTQDDLYVVVVGPASTYRGNNFFQSQIMQFNYIMEPVLDKLGVRLISRNMGMDASSTVSALGGADIYGEADILWYIPNDRSEASIESDGQLDLLHKQAILSGERMPLILTPNAVNLVKDTNGEAWVGNIQPGADLCQPTTLAEKTLSMPDMKACEYLRCTGEALQKGLCDVYNSVCWVDRVDFEPDFQDDNVGYQHGYPNFRQHQWEGRKLSMLVLRGLEAALKKWAKALHKKSLPLPQEQWHVGGVYEKLRESVRSLTRTPGESVEVPACEVLLSDLDPMICHMSMHAFTEWTPRVNSVSTRLKANLLDDIVDRNKILLELYDGVDLLPDQWKVPEDEVDVHLVALATNTSIDEGPRTTITDGQQFHPYGQDDSPLWDLDDDPYVYYDDGNERRRLRARTLDAPSGSSALAHSWSTFNAPLGFCDGSAQSRCNRKIGNTCLLANHNAYKAGILGHGESGWLHVKVPVEERIVLVRFEWDMNLNDGRQASENELKDSLPEDFEFDYSIDGKVTKLSREQFLSFGVKLADDMVVYPLLMDKSTSQTLEEDQKVEVGIQIRTSAGSNFKVLLTHVYYA